MAQDYWHRQTDKPLYPDLLWARPETKGTAGKLLIIGGHAQSFAAPADAYASATKAGIGVVRVMLPSSLERMVGKLFPEADFAPSNPSGGFATSTLAELLDAARWSDGVVLAGDLGRNSETAAMLEQFIEKYTGQLTITKDAADYFCSQPNSIQARPDTLLVISMGQLQKLGLSLKLPYAFTSDLGLVQLVELLHDLTTAHQSLSVITHHQQHKIVAVHGQVGTHKDANDGVWRVKTAAGAATWWLQNPTKTFEACVTSIIE